MGTFSRCRETSCGRVGLWIGIALIPLGVACSKGAPERSGPQSATPETSERAHAPAATEYESRTLAAERGVATEPVYLASTNAAGLNGSAEPAAEADANSDSPTAGSAPAGGTLSDTAAPHNLNALTPASGGEPPTAAVNFIDHARFLYRVAACGQGDLPEGVSEKAVEQHCKQVTRYEKRYRDRWLSKAEPFFKEIVPGGLPKVVVYPFGGADLLTALAIFPELSELTTISLEPAGDPRAPVAMSKSKFRKHLNSARSEIRQLLYMNHSITLDMIDSMRKGKFPTHLVLSLAALRIHGYEPVSLHYFDIDEQGAIAYLGESDVAEADQLKSAVERGKKFANMELRFRKAGGGPTMIYRHVLANLADKNLEQDSRILSHLRKKGRVTAMTKAASYLLWWDSFSTIRGYLLKNMEWMVSDSTGIPPRFATPAGFEQQAWGKFRQPFLPGAGKSKGLRDLFKQSPQKKLTFRFGYPDKAGANHLMVTRKSK